MNARPTSPARAEAHGLAAVQEALVAACAALPDVLEVALVLLPDGVVLAGRGAGGQTEHELLARATVRCFGAVGDELVEGFALFGERMAAWQRGRHEPRLALCAVAERRANLSLFMIAARAAMEQLEREIDVDALDP